MSDHITPHVSLSRADNHSHFDSIELSIECSFSPFPMSLPDCLCSSMPCADAVMMVLPSPEFMFHVMLHPATVMPLLLEPMFFVISHAVTVAPLLLNPCSLSFLMLKQYSSSMRIFAAVILLTVASTHPLILSSDTAFLRFGWRLLWCCMYSITAIVTLHCKWLFICLLLHNRIS